MKKNKIIIILIVSLFIGIYNLFKIDTNTSANSFEVSFFNVGQADSSLIKINDKYVLIDAGNNEDGDLLVNYLKNKNIETFEYIFATHLHEDHIGGMDNIINNFNINNFYMPDSISTSKSFEDMLDSLENKNIEIQNPYIDETLLIDDVIIKIMYVDSENENINNTSIIIKIINGNNSFLFMGDADSEIEEKIINKDISSDVIKIGHHGSSSSTSKKFIENVNPKYAVISVGENSYGHPSNKVIERLNNIKIYRTDIDGTIIMSSDGNNLYIETKDVNLNG